MAVGQKPFIYLYCVTWQSYVLYKEQNTSSQLRELEDLQFVQVFRDTVRNRDNSLFLWVYINTSNVLTRAYDQITTLDPLER